MERFHQHTLGGGGGGVCVRVRVSITKEEEGRLFGSNRGFFLGGEKCRCDVALRNKRPSRVRNKDPFME